MLGFSIRAISTIFRIFTPEANMKIAIIWLASGLMLALTVPLGYAYLWILILIPVIIWAIFGLVLGVVSGWRLRRADQRRRAAATLLCIAAGVVVFLPTMQLGAALTDRIRFAVERPRYQKVISMLQDSIRTTGFPAAGRHDYEGLVYVVHSGRPLRLAFPWPGGIIDNWCGAVYDPTSAVLMANNFTGDWAKWEEQVDPEIKGMFGGDLVHCSELKSPFYHCCFT
jgi:hypothetical protein